MEFVTSIQHGLLNGSHSTALLMVGIVILSYLLEDVAIVTAAAMSSNDLLPTHLALLAIFLGIATGDLGLYWLGRMARKVRAMRFRLVKKQKFRAIQKRLLKRAFVHLFIIRFVPGLRTVGYSVSGFIAVPVWIFTAAVLLASVLWTSIIFGALHKLGSINVVQQNMLLFVLSAAVLMWLVNKTLQSYFKREAYSATK